MNKMRFDVKCVKECLVKNKIVYTVRSWEGYKELSKVEVDGIGLCTKRRVMRVTRKDDLARYLSLSGFRCIDDWWMKICSFGACNGWLFEVRVIPASSTPPPEKRLKCPGCNESMLATLLQDLNGCGNCGCPAGLFDEAVDSVQRGSHGY